MLQPYSPDLAPLDFHLFGTLKQDLRGCQFHNSEEVEWLFINGCKRNSLISTATEFLTHAKMGQMHLLFNFYDLGNLTY
jgi:hypothetical protein